MLNRVLIIVCCLFCISAASGQAKVDQQSMKTAVLLKANEMASSFKTGDYKGYIKFLHPSMIQASGGETKMLQLLNTQSAQMKSRKIAINSIVFDNPTEVIKNKNEWQCTISQHTELKPENGRVVTYTTLVAISTDEGKAWKFVDAGNMDISTLRKLLPNLSNKITLPSKRKPEVYSM